MLLFPLYRWRNQGMEKYNGLPGLRGSQWHSQDANRQSDSQVPAFCHYAIWPLIMLCWINEWMMLSDSASTLNLQGVICYPFSFLGRINCSIFVLTLLYYNVPPLVVLSPLRMILFFHILLFNLWKLFLEIVF